MIFLVISCLLAVLAVLVAIPTAVLCFEIIAGAVSARRTDALTSNDVAESRAVLVPAHNESTGLQPTLADIRSQLRPGDRLLVVADNCSDDTALVARAAGAQVVERHDATRIGKGYALDFGIRELATNAPDIVVMIDADCRVAPGTLDELARTCAARQRPVQALDLMHAPANSQINEKVAEFAWRVKNWLRPLGLKSLGGPCQLMGTGMAFPWELISSTKLASSWLVEDVKIGVDLALAGHPPLFCPSVRVTSVFASSAVGAQAQRSRWEQGHIQMIFAEVPQLIWHAIMKQDWNLLVLGLDLAVPPLSLLAFILAAGFAVSLIAGLTGLSWIALVINASSLLAFALATSVAWFKCGRDLVPASALLTIVRYVFAKLGLYRRILFGRMIAKWVRTDRSETGGSI